MQNVLIYSLFYSLTMSGYLLSVSQASAQPVGTEQKASKSRPPKSKRKKTIGESNVLDSARFFKEKSKQGMRRKCSRGAWGSDVKGEGTSAQEQCQRGGDIGTESLKEEKAKVRERAN